MEIYGLTSSPGTFGRRNLTIRRATELLTFRAHVWRAHCNLVVRSVSESIGSKGTVVLGEWGQGRDRTTVVLTLHLGGEPSTTTVISISPEALDSTPSTLIVNVESR